MPRIFCANNDCISCERGECIRDFISIGDNDCYICEDYERYSNAVEYKNEFFMCVKAKDGRTAKAVKKGKLIKINGVDFYTTNDDRRPDYMNVTDVRTGLGMSFVMLQEEKWWQRYLEKSKTCPDVQSYPLAQWDEQSREYIIKESEVK